MGFVDFFEDIGNGIKDVAVGVYDGAIKPIAGKAWGLVSGTIDRFGRVNDAVVNLAEGAGHAAQGIGGFLEGNTNILFYGALALAGVLILPKLIDRVL